MANKHLHSENCPLCNIYKYAAIIDPETLKEIDKLDDLRKQSKSKVEEIKKENIETIKEIGKILEKINFERLPSGVFRHKKSQDDSKTIAADPVTAFNITIEGPLSAYDADPNSIAKIEKQLFDLHDDSDEEFTMLETKLKKQYSSTFKIRREYIDEIRKQLNNFIFKKLWDNNIIKDEVKFGLSRQKLFAYNHSGLELDPQNDDFKQKLIEQIESLQST